MERNCEVAVIGGGSTGSSILYHLAKDGIKGVTLIERGGQVASGQTSRSTALVRTHYSNPTVARMALLSYRFFDRFEEELGAGHACGFRKTGLLIGSDPAADEGLTTNVKMLQGMGVDTRLIERREAMAIEPELNPDDFSMIAYEPNSGYADPSLTAGSFASAAREMGAEVMTQTEVYNVEKRGGGGSGYSVVTSAGEVLAKKVVIATGVWSPGLFRKLKLEVPIRPVRHPVVVYRRPDAYAGVRPLIFDFPRKAYYKPEGSNLFYVGSLELELDVSKGEVDPDDYDQSVSYDEIARFSQWAAECLPVMGREGTFESSYTGVYDVTPDQEPVIGEFTSAGYPGLFALVGLSGHGFKLSPEFGRIMSTLVSGREFRDYNVSIFSLDRFAKDELIKSKYALGTIA